MAYTANMPTLNIHGTPLHYVDRGSGTPLVLLHGFPLDGRIWDAQLSDLASKHRVIAPDLRGFGKSESERAFTIDSLADDVHLLLGSLGAGRCILGGLSMGGYVTLAYAAKYPDSLRGIVLVDTRSEADTPDGKAGREKMIALAKEKGSKAIAEQMMPKMVAPSAAESRPEMVHRLREMMEACPALTIQHALAAMRDRPDYTPSLPKIAVPTLVIVGDQDAITPPEIAEKMVRLIPSAKLAVIRGSGHMSPIEQPTQVSKAIAGFAF